MTSLCEMCIKTGILLATFGMANSVAERGQNRTKEIVILGYEAGRGNLTAANNTMPPRGKKYSRSPDNEGKKSEIDLSEDESDAVVDARTPTTQSSKLLFSYVVPAKSEKTTKIKETEEEVKEDAKDDSEDAEDDKEEVEEEEEKEEEDEHSSLEDEEEYEGKDQHSERSEEEEYEEDEVRPKPQMGRRRFDEDTYKSKAELEDEDEEHSRQEDEDEDHGRQEDEDDDHGRQEDEEEDQGRLKEEDEDHSRQEEEEEEESKKVTPRPITSWRQSHPPLNRERRPHFDFTTIQPYRDPRPVSYSSVVYDPEGNSKTEQSGSFYKKPLKVTPSSEVFRNDEENVSEDTKTISVTSPPVGNERSIQAPLQEDEEDDEDYDEEYMEPEAVTSNINYNIEDRRLEPTKVPNLKPAPPTVRPRYDWPEEKPKSERPRLSDHSEVTPRGAAKRIPEDEEESNLRRYNQMMKQKIHESANLENYYDSQIAPRRLVNIKPLPPMPRHIFDWTDRETKSRKSSRYDEMEDAPRESTKYEPKHQEDGQIVPKRVEKGEPLPPMARHAFDWAEEDPKRDDPNNIQEAEEDTPQEVTKREPDYEDEEDEEAESNPQRLNERRREQFHDKSNRGDHYEQTMNTRSGSKEKDIADEDETYESEVQDLMKPEAEPEEEWTHQSEERSLPSDEDEAEEVTEETIQRHVPAKKDRNQLYEYVVHDAPLRQNVKETSANPVTEAPRKAEVVQTTEAPTEKPRKTESPNRDKPHNSKPHRYAFGTIAKPESDQFLTFKNTDTDDVIYNQIVSNIQSLFTPTTKRPETDYEQHFLPSHGNCHSQLPNHDSHNYETFIKPSQTHLHHGENDEDGDNDDDDEEEEEDENNPMPASKKIPMKTYIVQKRIPPPVAPRTVRKKEVPFRTRPSGVKVTVYPSGMTSRPSYREAMPTSYRNSVYLGPVPSPNKVIRKVIYYRPNELPKNVIHYSPTNEILRIIRPRVHKRDSLRVPPSHSMLIIRKE